MDDLYLLEMMNNIHRNCEMYNVVLVGDPLSGYEYMPVPKYIPNEVEEMWLETANITRNNLLESPAVTIRAYHKWVSDNVHYTRHEYQMRQL